MGGPLLLYFPGKEPPHKEFLGWDPNWGDFRVVLYVYVLFSLLNNQRETFIFPVFQGEHINFLAWLTWDNQPFVPGPSGR